MYVCGHVLEDDVFRGLSRQLYLECLMILIQSSDPFNVNDLIYTRQLWMELELRQLRCEATLLPGGSSVDIHTAHSLLHI